MTIYAALIALQRDLIASLADNIHNVAETGTLAPSLIVFALFLGAIHALTPGHGKSVILSYFIGHSARVVDGLIMAGRVAFSHSLVAVLLVLLLGSAASTWGRPSGAAELLQMISYALITVLGLVYLHKAIRPPSTEWGHSPHVLPYAVGVLPCPLTMLIVGNAIAAGSLAGGIGLAAIVAIGATATISLVGAMGMLLRQALKVAAESYTTVASRVLRAFEAISSLAIFLIGLTFLMGAINNQ